MTGSSREFYGTGTNFFRYRYRYFFPGPIFSGTGTGTFFRDQIFPVPVPVLFSGTNFFRYRYRYHPKRSKIPGTGNSRDRDVTLCNLAYFRWPDARTPCNILISPCLEGITCDGPHLSACFTPCSKVHQGLIHTHTIERGAT